MAPLSFSPGTSISSQTLSASPAHPPQMDPRPSSSSSLSRLLAAPLKFLQPTADIKSSSISAAKFFLDDVASGISDVQSYRLQEQRRKRKRGVAHDEDVNVLRLKKLHTQGFEPNQVHEQVRKIIDATIDEIELALPDLEDGQLVVPHGEQSEDEADEADEASSGSSLGEEGVDWQYDGEDIPEEDELDDEQSVGEDLEMENGDDAMFSDDASDEEPAATYNPDPNGLNDGFFSIDDFNKQSDLLESHDARGEPVAEDDDEVDWDTDPFGASAQKMVGKPERDENSDEESDEEGPTFGNMDLNAREGESDDDDGELLGGDGDLDGLEDVSNANSVFYKDFFAPPAQKAGKNKKKRGRPNPHNFPEKNGDQGRPDAGDEDIEKIMARTHRDLFEDDDDAESDADLTDLDPSEPMSRRSTHERRQAKLAEQIRKLEAANVAKREWQLSGEASASARPLNSLLEEDLEFERAGKPVVVVTSEISESIEELIKKRILAGEFDEVRRRRPDDLATGPTRRRGIELEDTKSGKGLAELYEEDHLRTTDANYVDARDEKLKKEHAEIEALWKDVSRKLDSLSSWHYKPKPAAPNLEIRVDIPAIAMEDARPTAGGDVGGASMLAPQELYRPGEEKTKAEVVPKSGMPVAREEMTREQKLRRRRREKERQKKAGLNAPSKPDSGKEKKTKENKKLMGELKKGGVQVIGKKGQVTDVEGKQVRDGARKGAGSYKL
ncbi:U3 small nucleolar ribonucleoprotein complex, subunit Mpp10 [Massariosphaeria phaeospora]|uniref:U3 small nucleolar ribonucleoprotein protein MPP10 n=1 Tax=Massariosphaeria phaeospora TaxID=100035 RepID=A0A7C8IAQ8_9PLEO|nr:U3 small nucleolar ribonucleoprotein complex, subunit Mpp10 [Massariosphaeria phaeospora]